MAKPAINCVVPIQAIKFILVHIPGHHVRARSPPTIGCTDSRQGQVLDIVRKSVVRGTFDGIVARTGTTGFHNNVKVAIRDKGVITKPAVQKVLRVASLQRIIAITAIQRVTASPTVKFVVAGIPSDNVIKRVACAVDSAATREGQVF